ncbi:MAG: hypothetical protein WBG95_03400 [Sulfitobacter sp.]
MNELCIVEFISMQNGPNPERVFHWLPKNSLQELHTGAELRMIFTSNAIFARLASDALLILAEIQTTQIVGIGV